MVRRFFAVFAARKTKLTPVLYFLFVGAVLVNFGVLPEESDPFITLMVTAFWLNIMVPVTIALWKPYFSGSKNVMGQKPHLP